MIFLAIYIRSNSPGSLIMWGIIGFCCGLYLFYRGFQLLQRRRLILDTPFSKIRSASLGLVEVSGLAVGPYTLVAPITSRSCYYYRTQVWEYKQQGKNKQWVKVAAECMHLPFFLDDNTGRVLIDPRNAELDIHRDFQQEFCDSFFSMKEPAPENVRAFLEHYGISTRNKIKVEEFCIKPKNALFILGTLAENPTMEVTPQPIRDSDTTENIFSLSGFRLSASGSLVSMFSNANTGSEDEARFADRSTGTMIAHEPEIVRLPSSSAPSDSSGMTQQQKVAAAMTRAGIANPAAWAAAGLDKAAVTVSEAAVGNDANANASAADKNTFDQHPPVVLTKGTNNNAFMISWRSQREVARLLGWKCTLMIWGGPLLSLLSLYLLLNIKHIH